MTRGRVNCHSIPTLYYADDIGGPLENPYISPIIPPYVENGSNDFRIQGTPVRNLVGSLILRNNVRFPILDSRGRIDPSQFRDGSYEGRSGSSNWPCIVLAHCE